MEASPRGHTCLSCVCVCVCVCLCVCVCVYCALRYVTGCSSAWAARTEILKVVFLPSGWGEVDIPLFPTGLFVCASPDGPLPRGPTALGTVHSINKVITQGSGGSEVSPPRPGFPSRAWLCGALVSTPRGPGCTQPRPSRVMEAAPACRFPPSSQTLSRRSGSAGMWPPGSAGGGGVKASCQERTAENWTVRQGGARAAFMDAREEGGRPRSSSRGCSAWSWANRGSRKEGGFPQIKRAH